MSLPLAPHDLLDDGFEPERCDVLVIGCGNLLRGDDALGPLLVRELAGRQGEGRVPGGVRLVDGGTAGIDVAFAMRGAARVVVVDAAVSGNEPGTLYRLPAEAVAEVPPLEGLHTHAVRWDHALAFADWLLGPQKPGDITVFLVEAGGVEPGAPLTAPVSAALHRLADLLAQEFWPEVEITELGYLHLPAALAARYLPADACLARDAGDALELMPVHGAAHGGLVLKQRNAAGDRSLLVSEVLGFAPRAGRHPCTWDASRGTLVVSLREAGHERTERVRRDDDGASGAGALGRLPGSDLGDGRGGASAGGLPHRGEGAAGGRRRTTHGGAAAGATEGAR